MNNEILNRPRIPSFTLALGIIHDVYPRIMFYYQPVSSVMMIMVTYKTVILTTPAWDWLTLPMFFMTILLFAVLAGFWVWYVVIPQGVHYSAWLGYRRENIGLADMLERLDSIEKKIDRLREG